MTSVIVNNDNSGRVTVNSPTYGEHTVWIHADVAKYAELEFKENRVALCKLMLEASRRSVGDQDLGTWTIIDAVTWLEQMKDEPPLVKAARDN